MFLLATPSNKFFSTKVRKIFAENVLLCSSIFLFVLYMFAINVYRVVQNRTLVFGVGKH